jgi:hypothetical protein
MNDEVPEDKDNEDEVSTPVIDVEETETDELTKLTIDQSQKFFYQQFLDCNDILAALIIVVVLRSFEDNIVSDLDNASYSLFIYQSGAELTLDILFSIVTYLVVPKCK